MPTTIANSELIAEHPAAFNQSVQARMEMLQTLKLGRLPLKLMIKVNPIIKEFSDYLTELATTMDEKVKSLSSDDKKGILMDSPEGRQLVEEYKELLLGEKDFSFDKIKLDEDQLAKLPDLNGYEVEFVLKHIFEV